MRQLCYVFWSAMRSPVNLTTLAMRTFPVMAAITLLQEWGILPQQAVCNSCNSTMATLKTNHNYHYFGCSSCNTKSSVLSNSVLSNSNTKLREFVILMYLFCDNHRTYKTVQKETCINIDGYKDVKLSSATINKWFSYFRHLVVQDNKQYPPPMVGGIGDIVEIDESTLIDNGLKPQIIKT